MFGSSVSLFIPYNCHIENLGIISHVGSNLPAQPTGTSEACDGTRLCAFQGGEAKHMPTSR